MVVQSIPKFTTQYKMHGIFGLTAKSSGLIMPQIVKYELLNCKFVIYVTALGKAIMQRSTNICHHYYYILIKIYHYDRPLFHPNSILKQAYVEVFSISMLKKKFGGLVSNQY